VIAGLAIVMMLGMGYANRNLPEMAEWYTNSTVRAPDLALRVLAFAEDERAFYTCARSVIGRLGESSIATFRARGESTTVSLGNGRYIVRADVKESDRSGTTHRHAFSCTVRLEGPRWIIEGLDLWRIEAPVVPSPAAGT
jgi:hypothetical protein